MEERKKWLFPSIGISLVDEWDVLTTSPALDDSGDFIGDGEYDDWF